MTTMAAAFKPVIEQVLAERERQANLAVRVIKTLNTKGNLAATAKWHRTLVEVQAQVIELRRRQATFNAPRCHGCRAHGRKGCGHCCKAAR